MNAPYYRDFFNRYISIHAKTKKELNRALIEFDDREITIHGLESKPEEAADFIKAFVKNEDLKIAVVFYGEYLIGS